VNKRVEFLRFELEPDPSDTPQLYAHEGEQYGVLIQGKVEIRIRDATYILKAGDSVFFDATIPHYARNVGRTKAVMIWAISPPSRPLSVE
jgi:quercetin dioxygenase-like cupin family protein